MKTKEEMPFHDILRWPGKSACVEGGPRHPAVYHMLDTAAVAEVLLAPFGIKPALSSAFALLVCLHDIGKMSEAFLDMIEGRDHPRISHWKLSEVLLHEADQAISVAIGGTPHARRELYAAVAGHHGQPSILALGPLGPRASSTGDKRRAMQAIGSARSDAQAAIAAVLALHPEASLDGMTIQEAKRVSWWLPGLCAVSDWIASKTDWFAPSPPDLDLRGYLQRSRSIAVDAVREAGISGTTARPGALFDFPLRPMQAACRDADFPEGPVLAVIEDETGSGKTEAALILAHRMLLAGKGRGLYFALPTMATADAMFNRAAKVVGKMLVDPSLTLAHGRAGLSREFRSVIEGPHRPGEGTCSAWLAESRRRALLADVGVGTIDQALMSVLPVKHQCMRHFGLSSKILVVDEVHEMGEAYVAKELERLLQMHRAAGGSAILMTATLPIGLREMLLRTYDGTSPDRSYPAFSIAGRPTVSRFPPDARPRKGDVAIRRLSRLDDAIDVIVDGANSGAACAWIRNSVDEAIDAAESLRRRGIDAHLLHARYALGDRKDIERFMIERVGKEGTGRAGFVVVATQVIEASLDLDFDVMVSDIAPVASLIQRAGRLWRHMAERPANTRPVPSPILHILSPDPDVVLDDNWLKEVIGAGAHVYGIADVWRTARQVFARGAIVAPEGLRDLIEAVHGPDAEDVPEALMRMEIRDEGRDAAEKALAINNLVDLSKGYRDAGLGADDATYPTRLGSESVAVCLGRSVDGVILPWHGEGLEGWSFSELSVSSNKLRGLRLPNQDDDRIRAAKAFWPSWKTDMLLLPVSEGGSIAPGLFYGRRSGLSRK